jgi:hypothetical protein
MAFVEKGLRLVIKCVAVFFEMHEMCGASDLHIAFHGRRFQRVEEPMSINVGSEAVPFASDDRDRRPDQARIVSVITSSRGGYVLPRPAWRLDAR